MSEFQKDMIVMVADNDAELTIKELLERYQSIGIRSIQYDVIRHPQRDSGCRSKPEELLRGYCTTHEHALVIYDHHGSGRDNLSVEAVQEETNNLLSKNGWGDRAEVIVLAPELEIWMWSDSPEVDRILGWHGRSPSLREWIYEQGLAKNPESKPTDPKEAYHKAIRKARKAVSASHFKELAKSVSFRRCTDTSFRRFLAILRDWFQ